MNLISVSHNVRLISLLLGIPVLQKCLLTSQNLPTQNLHGNYKSLLAGAIYPLSMQSAPRALGLQQSIANPEPAIATKLQEINQKRAQKGQAPLDFQSVTREIEGIMNNPALSDKDKKGQIAQIRKKLGLSKKDMRTLFTQRLKTIYENAAQQIRVQIANTTDPIEKQRLTSLLQSYESKAGLYNGMFKSFWSKLGGVFKKIGGFLKTVASGIFKVAQFISPFLKFIPGIGQIASFVESGLGKVFAFLKDKISKTSEPFKSFLTNSYQSFVEPAWNQSKDYLQKLIKA